MMSTLLFSIERVAYFLSVIKVNYLKPCKSTSIMKKGAEWPLLVRKTLPMFFLNTSKFYCALCFIDSISSVIQ